VESEYQEAEVKLRVVLIGGAALLSAACSSSNNNSSNNKATTQTAPATVASTRSASPAAALAGTAAARPSVSPAAAGSPAAARPATGTPYEIGYLGALTGPGSIPTTYSAVMWGLKSFVQDLNSKGGVNGHPIHLQVEDDQAAVPSAIAGFTKLVDQGNVLLVDGLSLSNTAQALAPKANDSQVPVLFGPSSPRDTVQPPQKWMFAIGEVWAPLNDLAFKFILDKTGGKFPKVAVTSIDTAAGKEAADAANASAKAKGSDISATVLIPGNAVDFTPYIEKIVSAKPDWIIGNPYTLFTPAATQQLVAQLPNAKIFGATGLQDENQIKGLNTANYYSVRPFASPTEADVPATQAIVAAGKAANAPSDALTNVYFTEGWVQGMVIAKALGNCGEGCTRAKLRDALEGIASLDTGGLSGPIGFSADNHWGNPNGRVWQYDPSTKKFNALSDWIHLDVSKKP
jgi:branched-chain amino acid transport system substrate-binding protein